MSATKYPPTRREDVFDTVAGVSFADPYRWLESETEEVREWQHAQAQLASRHVREWGQYDRLQTLVERYSFEAPDPTHAVPRYAGGRWFRSHFAEAGGPMQIVVEVEPFKKARTLFEARRLGDAPAPVVSWISPSPDGRTLAFGLCADGSENNSIRLLDVDDGHVLEGAPTQRLMDNWSGGVHWLPDSSGFFFTALRAASDEFEQDVYFHRRAPEPATHRIDIPWTEMRSYRMVVVPPHGQHVVAIEGLNRPRPVAVSRFHEIGHAWRPFVTTTAGMLAGTVVGDRYVGVTDIGAPRGRLVAVALDATDPNDALAWRELVPEGASVMRTVAAIGPRLYLTEFVDTYSRVRILDHGGEGVGEVSLPGRGAVAEPHFPFLALAAEHHPHKFIFAFSTLTMSAGVYAHTPGRPNLEVLLRPKTVLPDAVVEDCWAISADGTRVPYHVVRRREIDTDEPRPTLIYGYGGYNLALAPRFPAAMASVVHAGGLLVHAHLRGGGELGLDWWAGGRQRRKQNCYDDLYAIAEDLIATRRTSPYLLGVTGRSNGGLMAGVAITQRPELWAVAVPRVPRLDLIESCREPYGRMSVRLELADFEEPDEVRRLATFSPYHLVREGIAYPAVYIDAGNADPRCKPLHARKFAAQLQHASSSGRPIVVHIWENAGHGAANDRALSVAESTEWIAFILRHLGVRDWKD